MTPPTSYFNMSKEDLIAAVIEKDAVITWHCDERAKYQQVCAAAYQLAGTVGAPVRFLDALGDAANGEIGKRTDPEKLLPVDLTECDEFPSAIACNTLKPDEIKVAGWYYRTDDDKYVQVEAYTYPVYKSGFRLLLVMARVAQPSVGDLVQRANELLDLRDEVDQAGLLCGPGLAVQDHVDLAHDAPMVSQHLLVISGGNSFGG